MKKEETVKRFELHDLPKVSLNEFFSRKHWTIRKKLNDTFALLIRSQIKEKIDYPCEVEYEFWFSKTPLDCSNCAAMVKMIEDTIFPNDSCKIVRSIKITSLKRKDDIVFIKVIKS